MVKKNSLAFSVFGVLALLTLMSFASATISFSNQVPTTLSQTGTSFAIDVASDVALEKATFSIPQITDYNGKKITFTVPSIATTINPAAIAVPFSYNVEPGFDFFGKEYSTTLTADGDLTSPNATQTLTFTQTSFCAWDGNNATGSDLTVTIRDVTVTKGYGQDDEWLPLDEIEVELRVKNSNNNEDIDNIAVEWGLFDKKSGDWVIEVSEEDDFNLNKGDDKTLILSFKLEDLDVNFEDLQNGDFVFYVRATGDVDADTEYVACGSNSKSIKIMDENDFVILNDIKVLPEETSCGGSVQITADVWSIGNDNQDDVYVLITNAELGISQKIVIGDINAFDNEKLDAVVKIPSDAEEKSYYLTLGVYNEDDGLYKNDYDDTESTSDVLINIASGSCSTEVPVSVTAVLETTAKAGEEFTVKATVTNTASVRKTFLFEVGGYTDWATFVSVDEPSLTLDAGKSADVLIKLKANEDASGSKNFNIVMKEGSKVLTQPVSVPVAGKGFSITGLFAGLGGNTYLWAIGALNVLLVLIIIVVAVRVVRKK